MLKLYGKALAGATVLPVARKLPGMSTPRELPSRELSRENVQVDLEHLAAYDRVCGFRLRDQLPATYPHMVAFPLAMELMTDTSFPFPVMGLVHIANRIDLLGPMTAEEPFDVRVWAADLGEHERGTQFRIHAEALIAGQPAWRSSSTYLHRSAKSSNKEKSKSQSSDGAATRSGGHAVWNVPGDIGRRYAAVSGDRNPIHMHPVTAKLFGMKAPIAHGMWTKARCLAAIESELPDAYSVDVRFKLPIFLPSKVAFDAAPSNGGWEFSVTGAKDGKPHLTGEVSAPSRG
ncbi:MAG TPA: MaoC/PaaZ C-terminal domain-containing protein [Thermoleophilaceae bacterium]